jgi:Rieske Fe-S protein
MTPESTRGSESRSGDTEQDPRPTRRGVLLGVSLAGLGGALAGCSTAAVPYDSNEAGVAANGPAQGAMPSSGAMSSQGATPSSGAMSSQGGGMQSNPAPASSAQGGGMQSEKPKKAKLTGTVLGAASEIPLGGGKIYTAAKVVVTQPARGQYKAFSAVCTHVGCIMSAVTNRTIDCPCHGSQFKITNGAVIPGTGPAPSPLPPKQIKIVDGNVILL